MDIQEIGIVVDLSQGTFSNTIYKDGMLQLIKIGEDSDGNSVYADTGYWESYPIVIQDKIRAFKNLVKTLTKTGGATYKSYVRVSDDGFEWGDYVETSEDGSVNNPPAKYAMIKIELFADKSLSNFYADRFEEVGKYDNEYVNSSDGVLELRKSYSLFANEENVDGNKYFTALIRKSNMKKIDRISINER